MRDNYDISKLNPRKNPYAEKLNGLTKPLYKELDQ